MNNDTDSTANLRNIGPKSAAWLRQVGLRTRTDLDQAGVVGAFLKIKRAGFKPSMNLLYALEGALLDCHWQEVPTSRREQLVAEAEAGIAQLPAPRGRPAAAPVTTTLHMSDNDTLPGPALFDDERAGSDRDNE